MAMVISGKTDSTTLLYLKAQFLKMRGSVYQEDIIIINLHIPDNKAL